MSIINDPLEQRILDAYNSGLEASGAHDFDDLLLLTYRLPTENEKIASFYRRLYHYICIDEAQDLNEAQYAVVKALCGADFNNVMMVGDPNQSIYGFTASSPKYMQHFERDFNAGKIALNENFRSSKVVVEIAHALELSYSVKGQLPIEGHAALLVGDDEEDEARLIADEIQRLCREGLDHAHKLRHTWAYQIHIIGRGKGTRLTEGSVFQARHFTSRERVKAG